MSAISISCIELQQLYSSVRVHFKVLYISCSACLGFQGTPPMTSVVPTSACGHNHTVWTNATSYNVDVFIRVESWNQLDCLIALTVCRTKVVCLLVSHRNRSTISLLLVITDLFVSHFEFYLVNQSQTIDVCLVCENVFPCVHTIHCKLSSYLHFHLKLTIWLIAL